MDKPHYSHDPEIEHARTVLGGIPHDDYQRGKEHGFIHGYWLAKKEFASQDWISLKEKSPEVNQWVLGFILEYDSEDRNIIGEDISVVSRNYEGDWFENAGDVIDYAEVTHWMPLPKAPTKD